MRAFAAAIGRVAPTLATLAVLVLGGFLAARWVTYFAAPSGEAPPPARERPQLGAAAQTLAAAHLFGVAPAGATVSSLNVKLRGVFAGGGTGTGYAIVNAGGRDEATRIGAEIVSGVTLEAVHAGHIMVRRGGALERVELEERTSAQAPAAPPPRYAQAPPPARRSVPAAAESGAPAQASGPGAQVRRPESPAPVGNGPTQAQPGTAPQGLLIQEVPPGSMLERIGLQPGDVVRSVNGEAVSSEADVARVLQSRGLQGAFTAEVQRGGMTVPIAVSSQR